jgi:hypothetical protein
LLELRVVSIREEVVRAGRADEVAEIDMTDEL